MKVRNIMSSDPFTISPDAALSEAFGLMKKHKLRRLPVVDRGKLLGIITQSDLYHASPSRAIPTTALEEKRLLANTRVRDIMPENQQLITVIEDAYIEQAAKILRENKIGGMPVVNEQGRLVGIITETNIFDALLDLLAVNRSGTRITLRTDDRPGCLKEVVDLLDKHNVNVENLVKTEARDGRLALVIRINTIENKPIVDDLKKAGFDIESIIVKQ